MVQMFPTIFDHTLEHLFLVEKLPRLSRQLIQNLNLKIFQADLRLFRMFLWCIPDCDANLLAGFNFVATSTAQLHKVEELTGCFSLTHDEYESLARKVEEEMRKCFAEMNKYRQHLISCSLKAEPFTTSDETIRFLDYVHVISNDLLKCYEVEFLPITSHVETLQETVFLLRNLVYYTPMGGENYDISFLSLSDFDANPQPNLIFQFNIHDWANKAACFILLYWLIGREDEEIRRLYTDLQQKVGPCNPDFIKLCFQSIKVPKMKREDRIHFGEFVSSCATLKYIAVHSREKRVADSAIQIQKDQFDSGNMSFDVDTSLILE